MNARAQIVFEKIAGVKQSLIDPGNSYQTIFVHLCQGS